jgi:hypothetical protein
MQTEGPQPNPDSAPSASPAAGSVQATPDRIAAAGTGLRLPLWLLTAGAGLVAGLISWAGGEATFGMFKLRDAMEFPPNYNQVTGYDKTALTSSLMVKAGFVIERRKAAAAFGLLGLLLGLSLGLTGGLAVSSAHAARTGGVFGGVVGAAVGGGLSFALVPLFFRYLAPAPEQGLLVLFITHVVIFAGIGAASGLALGLALNDRPALGRAVFGGVLGALLGTFAFETINSLGFPLVRTFEPIPTVWLMRLNIHLCVAVGTGLLAGLAAGRPAGKAVSGLTP